MLARTALVILTLFGLSYGVLDLKTSVTRVQTQINKTETKIAKWNMLPEIINMTLPCLVNGIELFQVEANRLPNGLEDFIHNFNPVVFAKELLKVNWAELSAQGKTLEETNGECESEQWCKDLAMFMNSSEFKTIHNHIWNDAEFIDVVAYISDVGYKNIYADIKSFYKRLNVTDDLKLPDGPPPPSYPVSNKSRKAVNTPVPSSNSNFPIIKLKTAIIKETEKCNIQYLLKIYNTFNKSNIQEVVKIFLYALQEFIGNAAVHFLFIKIGEPQKGEFFHSTLNLPEMEKFLPHVQNGILHVSSIKQLNVILRQVTGLDIGNMELFKYLIDLFEYLIWNYPFPE